ncbi:MAG TPA: methyltransferase domain-containing protein [Solirubrobacteraceae bacterium]|nr:methyltransferase domain-containing protein [Solirubrobacteraceae bacterium]
MSDAPKAATQPGGYERRIGRYGASLAEAFLDATGIRPGQRVLDVGCGTGALTAPLAARVGADCVAGVDPVAADVATCATRVPGADLRTGEAEALPFADDSFDAVLAQLVVSHLRDAERGVREMARVARPDGVVAACVWDFAEGMVALRSFWDAAAAVDAEGAAAFDQAKTHAYATPEQLTGLWEAAGLRDVRTGALAARSTYSGFDDLWEPMLLTDGAPGRFLATVGVQQREAVRDQLFDILGRPAGPFELQARAWSVEGRAG